MENNISIKDLIIVQKDIEAVSRLKLVSDRLALYYEKMAELQIDNDLVFRYRKKANDLKFCNHFWVFDVFPKFGIKDRIGTMSCKNKFCPNCKKRIQASRVKRFTPELNKVAENYDIYHLTLTLPNIKVGLRDKRLNIVEDTINSMAKSFQNLNRYFKGNSKIHNIDFSPYGYAGGLRSLEIVTCGLELHPHYHCLIALKKGLEFEKYIYNKFSKKKDGSVVYFSAFEVLIQKIWRLLIDGQKVTYDAIQTLQDGYSCYIRKVEDGGYAEIFKYVTKPEKEEGYICDFSVFYLLEYALYNRRAMQGYGVFYNIQPDDSIDEKPKEIYDKLINFLKDNDVSFEVYECLEQIMFNMYTQKYIYITRSNIAALVREFDEQAERSGAAADNITVSVDYTPAPKLTVLPLAPEFSPEQLRILDLIERFVDKEN